MRSGIAVILGVLMAGTAGCTLGPEAHRPDSIVDEQTRYIGEGAVDQAEPPDMTMWWRTFEDPTLDALVDRAVQRNLDLRIAAARVMEAEALLGVAAGQRWPSLEGSIGRDRRQTTFEFTGDRFSSRATTYTMELRTAWQVDLFGKLRRGQERALYDLLASRADRDAMLHTIIAQTVETRALIATLQAQLDLVYDNTASFASTAGFINRRYENGVTTALELRLAKENLAFSRSREPQFERQLREAEHALDVLLARQPGSGDDLLATLPEVPPLAIPETGLPLALLDRRPDLRAAEYRAMANQAGIGVAMADLFPDITISASGGYQTSNTNDWITPESLIWDLLAQATWKILQGGALRANVDAERARAEAAAAQYAKTVLTALREVEDALAAERLLREQYEQLKISVEEAREAENLARARYERGVENILAVLETERRKRDAEDRMIAARFSLWQARVNLYLALGGDWGAPMPDYAQRVYEDADWFTSQKPWQRLSEEQPQENPDE